MDLSWFMGSWVLIRNLQSIRRSDFASHTRPTPFEDVEELKAGFIVWAARLCETGHFPVLAWLNYLLNGSDLECGCTQCDWNLAVQIVALLPLLFLFFPLVFPALEPSFTLRCEMLMLFSTWFKCESPRILEHFQRFLPIPESGDAIFFPTDAHTWKALSPTSIPCNRTTDNKKTKDKNKN